MSAALILELIVALALGAFLCHVVLRRRHQLGLAAAARQAAAEQRSVDQAELIEARERLVAREREAGRGSADLERARSQIDQLREELMAAREAMARTDAELKEAGSRLAQQTGFFESARETLNTQFKTLANEILEEKGKRLSELHRGELGLVLGPLSDKLATFQKKVEEIYVTEGEKRFSLFQEVQKLELASAKLSDDANNLTRALKGEAKTRGNWGEVMLEAILERSGLEKGREYQVQTTLHSEDGRLRPDVIIKLPDAKHIVVDSKVSLVAYDRYYSAESDAARDQALREHVESVRRHIGDLGKKNYHGQDVINSPDFVVMFVPIEPAFNLAAGADPGLIFDAFDKKVVIVTPGTLLAMLSTVATLWRREQQSANALEIARKAGDMYDKFVTAVEHFEQIGRSLQAAQDAFGRARTSFSEGRGNVVKRLEDLRKLGAKAQKSLPADLLMRSGVDDDADAGATTGTLTAALLQPDLLEPFNALSPGNQDDAV